jgi:hypothetical protein
MVLHVLRVLVLMRRPMMMVLVVMLVPFLQGCDTEQFVDGAEARETGRQEENGNNAEERCSNPGNPSSQIQNRYHDSKEQPQYPVDHSHVFLHHKHLRSDTAGACREP